MSDSKPSDDKEGTTPDYGASGLSVALGIAPEALGPDSSIGRISAMAKELVGPESSIGRMSAMANALVGPESSSGRMSAIAREALGPGSAFAELSGIAASVRELTGVGRAMQTMVVRDLSRLDWLSNEQRRLTELSETWRSMVTMPDWESLRSIGNWTDTLRAMSDFSRLATDLRAIQTGIADVHSANMQHLSGLMTAMTDVSSLSSAIRGIGDTSSLGELMQSYVETLPKFSFPKEAFFNLPGLLTEASISELREQVADLKDAFHEITPEDMESAQCIFVENAEQHQSIHALFNPVHPLPDQPRSSRLKAALLVILLHGLAHFAWAYADETVKTFMHDLGLSPADVFKRLKQAATLLLSAAEHGELNNVRQIQWETQGFTSYKHRSQVIARLDEGKMVRVLKRRGRWSFIEWLDDHTGKLVRGWVRTKRLKQLASR